MESRLTGAMFAFIIPLIIAAVQPVHALSSFETDATRDTASGTTSDPLGPATTGSLFSEVLVPGSDGTSVDFSGTGYARGAANDTGAGAVDVNGAFFSGNPFNQLTGLSILNS